MNRLTLAFLALLTACATANAEPPKADAKAPARAPIVVWSVPVPFFQVCQLVDIGGKWEYQRSPATAQMTCPQFSAALQGIQAKFGEGATRIDECVAMDPCFAKVEKPDEKK